MKPKNKKIQLRYGENPNQDAYLVKNIKKSIFDYQISGKQISYNNIIDLDSGLKYAEKLILRFWEEQILNSTITLIDSKTKLQEYSLKKFKELPKYIFSKKTGPQHRPIFKTEVQIPNSKKITGIGSSKKNAQQNAAFKLLKLLRI